MQFNLLLLDHGELLLESALCSLRIASEDASLNGLAYDTDLDGRLWLSTRSVFFEPRASESRPILRFPFKPMPEEPAADGTANTIAFRVKRCVEMRRYQPYTSIDFSQPKAVIVSLKHTKATKLCGVMQELWNVSQKSKHANDAIEEKLLKPIIEPRLAEPFDRSRLVDFREQVDFPARQDVVVCVERVEPLVNVPGCLLLTKERVYFQHSRCNNLSGSRQCLVWQVSEVVSISKRRYMMQQRGLELRFTNDRTILIVFRDGTEVRDEFYRKLVDLNPSQLAKSTESKLSELTRQWQQRQIDNYTYLCALNEEADRSRHDLTQYPVFPWVVADYSSPNLDFSKPSTFRDLSKPIGALDENRLRQFRERFEAMDPNGDPPPFLYGTHYSTPGFVLFYLIRERPEEMLRLQSGKFDAPDRMFHSVADAWRNVLTNPADVKELIPEFYSGNGDFLLNTKRLDLGKKGSDSKHVNHVDLPPWANNSPKEFITKMREALESEYVSEHLHLWIDLIFGCDQRSIERNNVFFHLTYQDATLGRENVDETTRKGNEVQIMEFGQTPKQLFSRPHPKRNAIVVSTAMDVSGLQNLGLQLSDIQALTANGSGSMNSSAASTPMPQFGMGDKFLQQHSHGEEVIEEEDVDLKRTKWSFNPKQKFKSTQWIDILQSQSHVMDACPASNPQSSSTHFYAACRDGSLLFLSNTAITRRVRISKLALSCVAECSDEDVLIGSWDNALYRYSVTTGRTRARIENAHEDSVASIHARKHSSYLVTGGDDAAVKLWSNETLDCLCAFYEHDAPVTSVALSEDERVVLSCDSEGGIKIHDPRIGPYSVWSTSLGRESEGRRAKCEVAWLSTRSKILACSPNHGLRLLDSRKNKVVVDVQSPSWRPRAMLTDAEKIMVGDQSGRVTLAIVDKMEQVPFESNVILRHSIEGQPGCVVTLAVVNDTLLSCCSQGLIGLSLL